MRDLNREICHLKIWAVLSTLGWAVSILCGFAPQGNRQKFEEIDAQRINIVEPDGQIKLLIANKERLPGPGNVVTGKFEKRSGLKSPGMLFYNERGDESGGLIVASVETQGKYAAGTMLAFDKYRGDQVMGLSYSDEAGKRTAGFQVWDQPDGSAAEQNRKLEESRKLPPGAERDALRQQAVASQRVFVGRTPDGSANVTLLDANSRPRIRMSVGAAGEGRLEFLDRDGKTLMVFPESSGKQPSAR